jgi:uncharacterized membrane protein (UPF0127 family)
MPPPKDEKQVTVRNLSAPNSPTISAKYCASFLCRLRGLMFRKELALYDGLLLVQERENRLDAAIHMLGMFIDLGIVWINESRQVVDVRRAYKWRSFIVPRAPAKYVLETSPEAALGFGIGDEVAIE